MAFKPPSRSRAATRAPKLPIKAPNTPSKKERDRGWLAVQQFSKMVPSLNSFARSMTGDQKVTVKSGKLSMTDGRVITIRPPLELADKHRHDRSMCDRRDNNRTSLCEACRVGDKLWSTIYHEISHIAKKTFEPVGLEGYETIRKFVTANHPIGVCSHVRDYLFDIDDTKIYLQELQKVDPLLKLVFEFIEDARVDSAMLSTRPGLADVFYASNYDTFENGVEKDDGERIKWNTAPLRAQILVALLIIASGYEIELHWLDERALAVAHDPRIEEILFGLTSGTVHDSARKAVSILHVLEEMGLYEIERCQPKPAQPEPEEKNDPEEGEKEDEEFPSLAAEPDPSGGSSDDGEPGDDASESDAGDGDPETSGDDRSGDSAGEAEQDQTGDGTAGDSASDGAFGNDFENEYSRSDGDDQKGGSSGDQSKDASVPDDDDGESRGEMAESESDDASPVDPSSSGDSEGGDQADAVSSAGDQDKGDAPEDGGEAVGGSSLESSDSFGDAGADGEHPAPNDDGNSDGEPSSEGDEAVGSDRELLDGDDRTGHQDDVAEFDAEGDRSGDDELLEDGDSDSPVEDGSVWDSEEDNDTQLIPGNFTEEELGTLEEVEQLMEKFTGHDDEGLMTPEEVADALEKLSGGDDFDYGDEAVTVSENKALDDAIGQAVFFDTSSQEIAGVVEYTYPNPSIGWGGGFHRTRGSIADLMPAESIIGPALLQARAVFAANKRASSTRHLRSGKIDGRVLGRRAALSDERLFKKRHAPEKRDYLVAITIDVSGSNQSGQRMARAKRAAFAKAELLNRLGVKFYITAHTGGMEKWYREGWRPNDTDDLNLHILWIKKVDEPWSDTTRQRLADIHPMAENYDGHTLEWHRKELGKHTATDKILIYYTDGQMPAANPEEELEVMLRELDLMGRAGIKKLAVGINTDSPSRYGFDTVQVDSDEDLTKVVKQLERVLL